LGYYQGWKDFEKKRMIFSAGDPCWNGPERTVTVDFICGIENKIVNVYENGKCTYEIIFQTPLVCEFSKVFFFFTNQSFK